MNRKRKEKWFVIKGIQIVLSILIILCAVMAFLNSVKYRIMIPTALTMGALINLMNGMMRVSANENEDESHLRARGLGGIVVGGILALLAVAGFITL